MTQPVMTQSVNNQPVSHHICEYCGDGTPQQSTVWRKVVCCDDGTRQEVWCCNECWNTSLGDIPDEVLEYDPPDYDDDADTDEEVIDLCDE